MVSLERIQVKGFKSIREIDLELRPLNVLIGANGSGKSNFIEVFRLLRAIVEERLQRYAGYHGGARNLLHFGGKDVDRLEVNLKFIQYSYSIVLKPTTEGTFSIETEDWQHDNLGGVASGFTETHLTILQDDEAYHNFNIPQKQLLETIRNLRVYHFHDVSDVSALKSTSNLHDNDYLRGDGSNLAAFLYLLQEKHRFHYQKIVTTIQLVAPFFEDFILRPAALNENTIRLQWQDVNSDQKLDVSLLSDGTLRFIALTTLLHQPQPPPFIIIDEPELGLHPAALTILAEMLESASIESQIIVSTQSSTLINHLAPEHVIVVEREDRRGASTFRRLEADALEGWLDDYGLGDLWEKNIFGGRP